MTFRRKGPGSFVTSRLIRIAIPFVIGWFLLRPLSLEVPWCRLEWTGRRHHVRTRYQTVPLRLDEGRAERTLTDKKFNAPNEVRGERGRGEAWVAEDGVAGLA